MPFLRRLLFLSVSCLALGCSTEDDPGDSGDTGLIGDDCIAAGNISLTLFVPDPNQVIQEDFIAATSVPNEASNQTVGLEIWKFKNGEPNELVWTYQTTQAAASFGAKLTDGNYLTAINALEDNQDHGLRANFIAEGCGSSDFTEWQLFKTDSGASYFFDSTSIPTLDFHIPDDSYTSIDAEARPPGCVAYERNYYSADVSFEGQQFPGAGLRVKGGCGSARYLNAKAGFKSNLSWDDPNVDSCPETRRLHGLKKLTINNQIQDKSNTHERLSYHFYKLLDIPTPRVAPISLNVNDDSWGLYLNVESIDRRFLERWFGSKEGALYEGTYSCDLEAANIPQDENSTSCYSAKFTPDACDEPNTDPLADPPGYGPLQELIDATSQIAPENFYAEISQIIDMPRFIKLMAADVIIEHWDGYMFNRNNYRIYRDPSTGLWTFLPTGIDQTLFDRSLTNQPHLVTNPFPGGGGRANEGLISIRCLENLECNAEFVKTLKEAIFIFENAGLDIMAENIRSQISNHVLADPRTPTSFSRWNDEVDLTIDFIRNRPATIRSWLTAAGY